MACGNNAVGIAHRNPDPALSHIKRQNSTD
jgi:hypothetical protein